MKKLEKRYEITEEKVFEHNGYELPVSVMALKKIK